MSRGDERGVCTRTCWRSDSRFTEMKSQEELNLFSSRNHEQTYEPRVAISTALLITSLRRLAD
jgi:hypothetical protein